MLFGAMFKKGVRSQRLCLSQLDVLAAENLYLNSGMNIRRGLRKVRKKER